MSTEDLRLERGHMLAADGLRVRIGSTNILESVTMKLHRGDFVALSGVNGSGKSTLLRFLAGAGKGGRSPKPDAGRVLLNGTSVYEDLSHRQRRQLLRDVVAFLPQKAKENMLPRETFKYNMLLPFIIAKKAISATRIDELVDAYGVGRLISKPVGSLSGGEQQLVALMGLELVPEKQLFLLDEPFAALDSERSDMVSERLKRLAEAGGLVVMISHRDDEPLATRKIVLQRGSIVSDSVGPGFHSRIDL